MKTATAKCHLTKKKGGILTQKVDFTIKSFCIKFVHLFAILSN